MRRLRRGSGGLVVLAALLPLALPLGLAACSHQTKAESSVVGKANASEHVIKGSTGRVYVGRDSSGVASDIERRDGGDRVRLTHAASVVAYLLQS